MEKNWWNTTHRFIQTNLQIDQAGMDTEKLIYDVEKMGANGLLFNAGGVYAWYPSEVPYHTLNPYLNNRDPLGEVVELCNKKGIRIVVRFDFSKAEDKTYYHKPEWFVRDEKDEPRIVAPDRPGAWPLLMVTCNNGRYQKDDVGYPVLREVLSRYKVDGVFITSMFYTPCRCENCKRDYKHMFGKELPIDISQYEHGWVDSRITSSVSGYRDIIKEANRDVAFIHRFMLGHHSMYGDPVTVFKSTGYWFHDPGDYEELDDIPPDIAHSETPDMINTSAAFSRSFIPAASTNLGAVLSPSPIMDIINPSPGLGWRHTGLTPAEHRFWISQVAANGGYICHSLTGIPEVQEDKRVVETIKDYHQKVAKMEPYMDSAKNAASVALVWNPNSGYGWLEALTDNQIPYVMLPVRKVTIDGLSDFAVTIFPDKTRWSKELATVCEEYVRLGGKAIIEGYIPVEYPELYALTGIRVLGQSENHTAGYLRFEGEDNPLRKDLDGADIVPFCGSFCYEAVEDGTQVLASFVPPFCSPGGTGSPADRAIMLVKKTNIPLITVRNTGKGKTAHIPFALHALIDKYKFGEHLTLTANLIDWLLGDDCIVFMVRHPGVQLTSFKKNTSFIIHLVNGVGQRPLRKTSKLCDLNVSIRLPDGYEVSEVKALLSDQDIKCRHDSGTLSFSLDYLDYWEAVYIGCKCNTTTEI